ncbi:MAG: M1 family metallopeptidase [Thermoplasmata archaeon]|nr:M1 family metallopeptidase [Thermoplasmata archaeon]MCI4359725.1 M1 family metallopeptidase [Thermoplasmata archaeon]
MPPDREIPKVREYLIDLDVNHRSLWFTGTVVVVLEVPTPSLRLNSVDLEILETEPESKLRALPDSEEVSFEAPEPHDRWTVRFRGRASEKGLLGLYRSRYGEGYILTTQCAATAARNLFPCIDRPDRRAVVRLRLTIDSSLEAIFNTPPRSSVDEDGRTTIEFEPTPPMATYLVYLGVGQFEWFEGAGGHPTTIRGAAPKGRSESARYSVDRATEILPALERYFQIPFPLPKLDLIAVPEFAYGAMENWGAITFRDMRLLVDATTSNSQKRSTLSTIAHEIAHQWFGNLVTMEWWTDIWLNESFATFTEEKVLEELYPASQPLADLLHDWTGPAKTGDSLSTTHPVSVPVERPEEIGQIFDEISYGKGSAVLRMIEAFVGPEAFRTGVSAYLKQHAYANASSADLWSALEVAAGRPLHPILEAWITRPGLPLIDAKAEAGSIVLSQRRFLMDGTHRAERWPIPLALPGRADGPRALWDEDGPFVLPDSGRTPRLNVRAAGFYRVLYDPPLYDRLLAEFPSLPSEERWAVIEDLGAFLVSRDIPAERYYQFLDLGRAETDPLVVFELASQLSASNPGRMLVVLGALLGERDSFRRRARSFLSAQLGRLGLTARAGEHELEPLVRGAVASAGLALDPALRAELANRFPGYADLAPDLRWSVAFAFARTGGEPEYEQILTALARAPIEGEAIRFERALAQFPHPHLVQRTLDLALTPVFNRAHLVSVVREASLNPAGRAVTWEWIRSSLHTVEADYKGTSVIGQALEYALPFVGLGRAAEVRDELSARPFREGDRGANKGLAILALYERLLRAVD